MTIQNDFLIRRNNLADCQWQNKTIPSTSPGEIVFAIEAFALTANNITYAVAGDQMSYWQFFPADEVWGKIPVWGFATVVESEVPGIDKGARYYGYFPMSTHLTITSGKISTRSVTDVAEHRSSLSAFYNTYHRWTLDEPDAAEVEARHMLLQPLFATAFLLTDFFHSSQYFGAKSVLLTSASSKTSIGLAHLLHESASVEVIGLTSESNVDFVRSLGYYDAVYAYDAVEQIPSGACAVVDMAGNGGLLSRIHRHFGELLKYSCLVGITHWEAREGAQDIPGVKPELFFAPSYGQKRAEEWGADELNKRISTALQTFSQHVTKWMQVENVNGPAAIKLCYKSLLAGKVAPHMGYILKPQDVDP